MVEQVAVNHFVGGSSPSSGAKKDPVMGPFFISKYIYCLLILILFDIFAKKIFSSYFETSSFCYDKDLLYNYCPDSKHEKIVNNKKIITNTR